MRQIKFYEKQELRAQERSISRFSHVQRHFDRRMEKLEQKLR